MACPAPRRELESVGIRLNRAPPAISFTRKKTGGVGITSIVPLTRLDDKLITRILSEYKIHNADVGHTAAAAVAAAHPGTSMLPCTCHASSCLAAGLRMRAQGSRNCDHPS